jgi:hypothetical protein
MGDKLTIFRGAQRLLGDGRIASLSEDTVIRRAFDDAWPEAVNFLLTKGMWNFAIRTIEIEPDDDFEPLFGYTYSYSKPEDWIRTVSISETGDFTQGYEQYHDEQGFWFASVDSLFIRYISSSDSYGWNIGAWRQPFCKALEAYLAFSAGLPVTADRGNRNDLYQLFNTELKNAKTIDAVDEAVQHTPPGRLTRSRFGNRSFNSSSRGL